MSVNDIVKFVPDLTNACGFLDKMELEFCIQALSSRRALGVALRIHGDEDGPRTILTRCEDIIFAIQRMNDGVVRGVLPLQATNAVIPIGTYEFGSYDIDLDAFSKEGAN